MATQVISDLQRGSAPSLVLGRVAARAKEIPDAVAIACGDSRVTFAELETRSNQIAHLLICRGIGLGDAVAILMDRSPLFPVVALGVMKSGAAYLPIDTEYPEARINFVLRDAQASAVFVESEARGNALAGALTNLIGTNGNIAFDPDFACLPGGNFHLRRLRNADTLWRQPTNHAGYEPAQRR